MEVTGVVLVSGRIGLLGREVVLGMGSWSGLP